MKVGLSSKIQGVDKPWKSIEPKVNPPCKWDSTMARVEHLFESVLGRSKPVSNQFSDLLSN